MNNSSSVKVKCPECGKLCDEKHGLKSHVWRVHGPGKGTFDPNIGFVYGTRQIWNKGARAETPDQILVKGHPKTRLREALIEIGREYVCERCKLGPEWCGERLVLQVDHIDGDSTNQQRGNLRFLCPNCHSQTDTFGMRNVKRRRLLKIERSISG